MNGNIDWFPKPSNKIITVKEALKNIKLTLPAPVSEAQKIIFPYIKQGQCAKSVVPKNILLKYMPRMVNNKTFNFNGMCKRLHNYKPSPTITKTFIEFSEPNIHPTENRYLDISELCALCSFPVSWQLGNNYKLAYSRLGNAVMPKFMQAIAEHIKKTFLKKENPTLISTFAGTGGSSLGYKWANYKKLLAIEWDKHAVECFKLNFPEVSIWQKDITKVTSQEILDFCKLQIGELDIFDGSPPCQGFSTAGKRQVTDTRNNLFKHYFRLIKEIQPKVFLMENVSGMIKGTMKGKFKEILTVLKSDNYEVKCKLMNSMYYNVPQSRQRLIFIGVRKDFLEVDDCSKPGIYGTN